MSNDADLLHDTLISDLHRSLPSSTEVRQALVELKRLEQYPADMRAYMSLSLLSELQEQLGEQGGLLEAPIQQLCAYLDHLSIEDPVKAFVPQQERAWEVGVFSALLPVGSGLLMGMFWYPFEAMFVPLMAGVGAVSLGLLGGSSIVLAKGFQEWLYLVKAKEILAQRRAEATDKLSPQAGLKPSFDQEPSTPPKLELNLKSLRFKQPTRPKDSPEPKQPPSPPRPR